MSAALEVDHLLGLQINSIGVAPGISIAHPSYAAHPGRRVAITGIGTNVVVSSMDNAQDQTILEGHTAPVSCVAVSADARLAASGQVPDGNGESFVFIWDLDQKAAVAKLSGIHPQGVNGVSFSPDSEFLVSWGGCDQGELAAVSLDRVQVIDQVRFAQTVTSAAWSPTIQGCPGAGSKGLYTILVAAGAATVCELKYTRATLSYSFETVRMQLPSTGLARHLTQCTVSFDGAEALYGTTAGELLVFDLYSRVFKRSLQVSPAPVTALYILRTGRNAGRLLVGSAMGSVSLCMVHERYVWELLLTVQPEMTQRTTSTVSTVRGAPVADICDGGESSALIVQADGMISVFDFNRPGISSSFYTSPHAPVTAVRCLQQSPDIVVLGFSDGKLEVWSLELYQPLCVSAHVSRTRCTGISVSGTRVFSSWADGTLAAHDIQPDYSELTKIWLIPDGHRGGITALSQAPEGAPPAVVSGGADSVLRIWRAQVGQMVHQVTPHAAPITALTWDGLVPQLIHSAGLNATLVAIDTSAPRGSAAETAKFRQLPSPIVSMDQRACGAREMVVACSGGDILVFDFDINDPVARLTGIYGTPSTLSLSPSGRYVAVIDTTGTLFVWDLAPLDDPNRITADRFTFSPVCEPLPVHSAPVSPNTLSWTSDEAQLISAANDGCFAVENFFPPE